MITATAVTILKTAHLLQVIKPSKIKNNKKK